MPQPLALGFDVQNIPQPRLLEESNLKAELGGLVVDRLLEIFVESPVRAKPDDELRVWVPGKDGNRLTPGAMRSVVLESVVRLFFPEDLCVVWSKSHFPSRALGAVSVNAAIM